MDSLTLEMLFNLQGLLYAISSTPFVLFRRPKFFRRIFSKGYIFE